MEAAALEVDLARDRLAGKGLYRTPLQRALWLEGPSASSGAVFLKLESEQRTGSFKARGALNKVLSLPAAERAKGIVTASTGNHALAVASACQSLGADCPRFEIVLPTNASKAKVAQLKALGAPLRFFGDDCAVSEGEARREAGAKGSCFLSPYNDMQVIGGQGTVAAEILEQWREEADASAALDAVFVPVGGGGLISGIASYIKAKSPHTKVYGCSAKNDAFMAKSVASGAVKPADLATYLENGGHTLSEGTAGPVEPGSVTFGICAEAVDEWVNVTEEEIGAAVVDVLHKHHKAVEGAAGLGVAGYRRMRDQLAGKNVAIVICGGNVKADMLRDMLIKHLPVG